MLDGYGKFKPENSHSYGLSCAGFDIQAPRLAFDDGMLKMSIKLDKDSSYRLKDRSYCDDPKGEGWL